MQHLEAAIEALLFIYGEPITAKKIGQLLGVSEAEVHTAIAMLEQSLASGSRGLTIMHHDNQFQLATKAAFSPLVEQVMKAELRETLTPAALETLSIVAYGAPMTRSEIDFIRGVNSSFILRSLLIRGLVQREADPKRANSFIYKPSLDLLKYLGVSRAEDLPEYEKFSELAKKVRPNELAPSAPSAQPINTQSVEEPKTA